LCGGEHNIAVFQLRLLVSATGRSVATGKFIFQTDNAPANWSCYISQSSVSNCN